MALPTWVADRVRAHVPVVELRDYQDEAVTAVAQAVGQTDRRRVMVTMATGGGKTMVFGALAHVWLADGMGRVLILAHRDELIEQAVNKLSLWVPRHLIGVVKAARNETTAPVIVASVQTLRNDVRLAQVGRFGLIVVDEAHHTSAASYKKILTELGAFTEDGPIVVGVTATPKRGDGIRLDDVFEEIVFSRTYTELVAGKWLVPVESRVFELLVPTGRAKLGIDGDYDEGWLGTMMLGANAPGKILEAWQQEVADRKTLVFTPTVSVAKAVAETFQQAGVTAAWISGAMPLRERRAVLSAFSSGAIQVVANCAVLTEGFDEPSVSCLVIGRPTKNESLYIQMVGRGTRTAEGKTNCLILDMVGCADQLRLDAVLELGGRNASAGDSVGETKAQTDGDVPFEVQDGTLTSRTVKAVRPICRWVTLPDGWYALSLLDKGWITVEPDDDGTWRVVRRPERGRAVVEYPGLDVDWAKASGEGVARNLGAFGPMTRRAGWLDCPVSEKALAFGQRTGYPITAETTAWQFTVMKAERAYPRWCR